MISFTGLALPCIATFGITVHTATRRLFYEFAAQKEALHGGQHDEMAIGFRLEDFSFGFGFLPFRPQGALGWPWLPARYANVAHSCSTLFYAVFHCPYVPLCLCPAVLVAIVAADLSLCSGRKVNCALPPAACCLLPGQRLDSSCCAARKI